MDRIKRLFTKFKVKKYQGIDNEVCRNNSIQQFWEKEKCVIYQTKV